MKKTFTVVFLGVLLFGCKNKPDELSGDRPVTAEHFLKAFHGLNFPLALADTGLQRFGDTTVISYSVLSQFVPDSVLQAHLGGHGEKYVIHPAGNLHDNERDYLLVKFSSAKKNKLVVFVLNSDHKYAASLELLEDHANDKYSHSVSITVEPTFILRREKLGK